MGSLMPSKGGSMSAARQRRVAALIIAFVCSTGLLRADEKAANGQAQPKDDALHIRWAHFIEVPLPKDEPSSKEVSPWYDVIVPAEVFGKARLDLGDLRLFDASGKDIPYALRVRESKYSDLPVTAREFNRATGPDNSSEVTLDLGADAPEHNELDVRLPATNFRRHARLDASPDGDDWRKLVEHDLFSFEVDGKELHNLRLAYPPSRFRYLRLRVERDPEIDIDPAAIEAATVHYRVELPGEFITTQGNVAQREAVRTANGPGSAWITDLGVDRFPCEQVEVEVEDAEFARDYAVEVGGPAGADQPFVEAASGQWSRRAGEKQRPLHATFAEHQGGRLRLVVTDYSNPPLQVSNCRALGAARQLVFARSESLKGPLRLYYGNPDAEPPRYDLERNLKARIEPPPLRLSAGLPQDNPDYVAEPKPLTERFPWLIYVILGAASAVLALVIVSIGRAAVARDLQRESAESAAR
jgi:hypothetical protein